MDQQQQKQIQIKAQDEKYEGKFGKIQEAESPETPLGFNP